MTLCQAPLVRWWLGPRRQASAGRHKSVLVRWRTRGPGAPKAPPAGREALGVLGMSTEQRGETCSRSSPLGVLTEETHHQRDKGVEFVRPARGRPVEV